MKIIIDKIEISYFKGIKHLIVNCNQEITEVHGANGTGKTTIADAIQWCLFGKNAGGDTKFAIKTLDHEGSVIPNVEHSVKLSLRVDDKKKDVKRVWIESRKMDKGRETNEIEHHAEYYINGEKFTKKDFDLALAKMMEESLFRAVTSPTYFFGEKWQQQRAILSAMVGDVDKTSIDQKEQYKNVLAGIAEHDGLDAYLKHLSYNIKQVMEKMKQIPSRIDEQRQTMPEEVDWRGIEEKVAQSNARIADYQQQIASLKSGSDMHINYSLRKRLEFARKRIDNMVVGARNNARSIANEREQKERSLRGEIQQLERNLQEIESKRSSYIFYIKRAKEVLASHNKRMEELRAEWKENNSKTFAMGISDLTCPMCGRAYEEDKRDEIIAQAREKFNIAKAEKKVKMTDEVKALKEEIAECEAQITTYESFISDNNGAEDLKKQISDSNAVLNILLSEPLLTAEELLEQNISYKQARTEAHELELQIDGEIHTNNDDAIANLQSMIDNEVVLLNTLNEQKARKASFDAHMRRIAELEEEDKTLSIQLDKLQWTEDIAKEYEQECNELLEEKVNEMFSLVRFRLFETLNSGERKPNCIATVNGVGFSDLNSAMKINAGLDVLNAMQKYYDAYAPCIIDNAESVNDIMNTQCQQFRFYVSQDQSLIIK